MNEIEQLRLQYNNACQLFRDGHITERMFRDVAYVCGFRGLGIDAEVADQRAMRPSNVVPFPSSRVKRSVRGRNGA